MEILDRSSYTGNLLVIARTKTKLYVYLLKHKLLGSSSPVPQSSYPLHKRSIGSSSPEEQTIEWLKPMGENIRRLPANVQTLNVATTYM